MLATNIVILKMLLCSIKIILSEALIIYIQLRELVGQMIIILAFLGFWLPPYVITPTTHVAT